MKNLNLLSKTTTTALAMTMVFAIGCGNKGSSSSSASPFSPAALGPAIMPASDARNLEGKGPYMVNLAASGLTASDMGSAGAYVILAKAGVSNVTGSAITGDIGVSPAAASYITGFSLVADSTNVYSTSIAVIGKIFAADYAVPTPSNLTTAVGSMETAYTDAAGRSNPDFSELNVGDLGGLNLEPGLYKWSGSVSIPSNVTISGSSKDVWIFQISGDLLMASGVSITLAGGALAKNIFWQVAGQVDILTSAHFEGIILGKTAVNLQTSASMNGRIYSQTEVSLDDNAITQPAL
ncbi:MAG TPA: ice-binding family protein [Bacteriovoracaceae bacterium]|nr:ice-binding family protein [Bacteriovoracaceae bacterium]